MKITLISPPIEDFYVTGVRRQPLGLLYIASALKSAGYSPELINCHSGKKGIMELPASFGYLKKYINHHDPELKFPFKHYSHYGISWQEIELRIKKSSAEIYFISSLFTTYYEETGRIIEIIRKHSSGSIIAAGGYHTSLYPEHILNAGADFVILGEGEIPSVALVKAIESGSPLYDIPGLVFYDRGKIVKTGSPAKPDISLLPGPARELLLPRDMTAYRKKLISVITSRGCPNNCSFCSGKIVWGSGRRELDAESVFRELSDCAEKYCGEIFNFEDDNLLPSKKRAHELLEMIIRWREKTGISLELTAMNGISLENVDDEIIGLMKRAGFNELNISLVTHSADLQRGERRPFSSEKFKGAAESAKRCGMNVRGYFILGLPGQSLEEVYETVRFMKSIDVKVFPSVYYNIFTPQSEWKMQRSSAFFNESGLIKRDDLLRCFNYCFQLL